MTGYTFVSPESMELIDQASEVIFSSIKELEELVLKPMN